MKNIKVAISEYHYLRGQKARTLSLFLLTFPLRIMALFYFFAICAKNFLYNIGILKEKKVDAFVICVGNLTTGGVGKTPIVCELAQFCTQVLNKKTAVISRGYGAKLSNKKVNVIKNDKEEILFKDGKICGDEPLLIAQNTKKAVVLTCADRVKAVNFAKENFKTEVVILDDGFSNRKIYKDINILAVDAKKRFGNMLTLPAGPLREPLWQAKRANWVIVVNKDEQKLNPDVKNKILKLLNKKQGTVCNFTLGKLREIKTQKEIAQLGQKVMAFCAIGQPDQFYQYLHKKFDLAATKSYSDHYAYTKETIKEIEQSAKNVHAEIILTTQKDMVKIKPLLCDINPIKYGALELKAEFEDNELQNYIKNEIEKYETERNILE